MDRNSFDRYLQMDTDVQAKNTHETALVLQSASCKVSGPERRLLDSLAQFCLQSEAEFTNASFLKKYRFWEPILLNRKNFEESESLEKFAYMGLGIIVDGAVEVISQDTVKDETILCPDTDPLRINYPTFRDANSIDRIDTLLLPGMPIGLFEAMDRSLFEDTEYLEYGLQQRNYCIFAGTRSIFPCVAFGDKKLVIAWLKDRPHLIDQVQDYLGCSRRAAEGYLIRSGVVGDKGNLSLDQFNRLLLKNVAPTPYTTSILYFSEQLIESIFLNEVGDVLRKLSWSRLSKLEMAQNLDNLVGHEGPESLVITLAEKCLKVRAGEIWCLVSHASASYTCNGTDIELNHEVMCRLSTTFGESDSPLLLVPGFLSEGVEWGLFPLKQMFNELNRPPSWLKERLETKLRNKLAEISDNSFDFYYLHQEPDFAAAVVPEELKSAAQREKNSKSAATKILYPSILIKRR